MDVSCLKQLELRKLDLPSFSYEFLFEDSLMSPTRTSFGTMFSSA